MQAFREFRQRFHGSEDQGPDTFFGVTEAGKAALSLLFVLAVLVALVAGFWLAS